VSLLYLDLDPANPEDAQEVGGKFDEALEWLFARDLDRQAPVTASRAACRGELSTRRSRT
jgi:hypothetical protein